MQFFGIFTLVFGILIVVYPDLISILIGSFLIFIGLSTLFSALLLRRPWAGDKTWKVGSYEITRRK